MADYVLSFDVGTSGVKAAAVDAGGELRAFFVQPLTTFAPRPGWAEHDPEELWAAVCACARRTVDAMGGVSPAGLVFGVYWKAVLPVDADGKPLCRMLLWLDGRAGAQAERMSRELAPMSFGPREYWPRLGWLRESGPEIFGRTAAVWEAGAYLKYRATGRASSDYNNDRVHPDDPALRREGEQVLRHLGIPESLFPPRVGSDERAGAVTREAARALGVAEGVPVFGGTTDLAAVAVGAGCASPGRGHFYMGSSGWIGAVAPAGTAPGVALPFRPGTELIVPGMRSCGMTYDWARRVFYAGESHDTVDREVGAAAPGCGTLLCLPWLHGAKPPADPARRLTIVDADAGHGRAELMAAVLEGICFQYRLCAEQAEGKGAVLRELRGVGGCVQSPAWMQRMADILGRTVSVPASPQHAGAVGAAMCALVGLGLCPDVSAAADRIKLRAVYEPREGYRDLYEDKYRRWRELAGLTGGRDAKGEEL